MEQDILAKASVASVAAYASVLQEETKIKRTAK